MYSKKMRHRRVKYAKRMPWTWKISSLKIKFLLDDLIEAISEAMSVSCIWEAKRLPVIFFMSSPGVFYLNQSLNVISVKPHNRPLYIMLTFFEHFSEAKALSIIRAF